jgi:hypothetical protein
MTRKTVVRSFLGVFAVLALASLVAGRALPYPGIQQIPARLAIEPIITPKPPPPPDVVGASGLAAGPVRVASEPIVKPPPPPPPPNVVGAGGAGAVFC